MSKSLLGLPQTAPAFLFVLSLSCSLRIKMLSKQVNANY